MYFAVLFGIFRFLPQNLIAASGGALSVRDATFPVVVAALMGLVGILVGLCARK